MFAVDRQEIKTVKMRKKIVSHFQAWSGGAFPTRTTCPLAGWPVSQKTNSHQGSAAQKQLLVWPEQSDEVQKEEEACLEYRRHETQVWSLVGEDPLEEGMTTYSSILAWRSHGQRSLGAAVHRVTQSLTLLKWLSTHAWEVNEIWDTVTILSLGLGGHVLPLCGFCLASLSFTLCLGRLIALRTFSPAWTLSL